MTAQHIPAYLLHSRKYTDSRVIIEILTKDFGVLSGVHRLKSKKKFTVIPPSFTQLIVSWGKGLGLKTIYEVESINRGHNLIGNSLFAAMYVNELILRLLPKEDTSTDAFTIYETVLAELEQIQSNEISNIELPLRKFELLLLSTLGYCISFIDDTQGKKIRANSLYRLEVEQGFVEVNQNGGHEDCSYESLRYKARDTQDSSARESNDLTARKLFCGASLLAIAQYDFTAKDVRKDAKVINRCLLKPLLGDKPLKSRELFVQ